MRGRTIRLLRADTTGNDAAVIAWDGRDAQGRPVASGTYFLRWDDGVSQAAGKVLMLK